MEDITDETKKKSQKNGENGDDHITDPNEETVETENMDDKEPSDGDKNGENDDVTKETDNGQEGEGHDDDVTDHVGDILGAGAGALKHSLLMFGDPKLSTSGDITTENDDVTAETDDVSPENCDDSFVHEDEKDVTRHDDKFDIDVRIRLIKPEDEAHVRTLIYGGIYVTAVNRALLNATERPMVISFVGLWAVLFSWLFGGIIISLVLSVLGIPLCIYLYVRYVALALYRRRHLPDVSNGVYIYWSAMDHGRVMWVAEVESKVVACIAVETHSAVVAEIKHLSVSPEWQCVGIGNRLAQHVLSHVRRRRFKKVIAHVLTVHSEATNMYSKLGFRKTNVRQMFRGFCSVEDFDLNVSTGSQATLDTEE